MDNKKIKIVWICHFSNPEVRSKLLFRDGYINRVLRKMFHRPMISHYDFAQWITNGISAMNSFSDLEIHIVAPHAYLENRVAEFESNNIHYHFFRSETENYGLGRFKKKDVEFHKNRRVISKFLNVISPDIVHVFGAENPYYSISLLDVVNIPTIVSLQTLLTEPNFIKNHLNDKEFNYKSSIEKKVIQKATYIGTKVPLFRQTIWNNIKPDAIFLNISLFIEEKINISEISKDYSFVYFANNISKAADLAIEAFAIAQKQYPAITLYVIGDFSKDYKDNIDKRLAELGITEKVFFAGLLPTHDDVLLSIKKAKYALLPLKVDVLSSTIREAIASGLPVVSTITSGTPFMNIKRESLLISEIGDHQAMADNMIKLIESDDFADRLKNNALITYKEKYSDKNHGIELLNIYKAIYAQYNNKLAIPSNLYDLNPALEH